jgi:hypothetical protein
MNTQLYSKQKSTEPNTCQRSLTMDFEIPPRPLDTLLVNTKKLMAFLGLL